MRVKETIPLNEMNSFLIWGNDPEAGFLKEKGDIRRKKQKMKPLMFPDRKDGKYV